MEQTISERGPGPWIYMLNENSVDEFIPKWLVDEAD
jgi:hypothetical protein